MNAVIRALLSPEDARLAVDLQRKIWGSDETPAHILLTAAHNGGLCAGTFVAGSLVGFVWGFLGLDDRACPPRLKHCSHQLGVDPAFRNLGLGFALKRFQWEFVRSQGVELITWTYDPLLSANAQLNIARLGAVCSTYRRDEYGELDDDLNAGLPTDRLQVDLWVNSPQVCEAMQRTAEEVSLPDDLFWLNPPGERAPVLPTDVARVHTLREQQPGAVALAIPADFQADRTADPVLAARWRYATREAFETLFAQSYAIVGFVRRPGYGCYLLERRSIAGS